jgi:flap endonuclease-1
LVPRRTAFVSPESLPSPPLSSPCPPTPTPTPHPPTPPPSRQGFW